MKDIKLKIVSMVILVSLVGGLVPAREAQAIWPVVDKFKIIIDKIFHALHLSGQAVSNLSLGLPGTGAATRAALKSGKTACTTYGKAIKIADAVDAIGSAEVIAGSAARLAKLSVKMTALNSLRNCYQLMLDVIEKGGTVAGVSGNQALQQLTGEDFILSQMIVSLDERIDKLKGEKHSELQGLWKGVAIRTLMRVQQRITTNLVNKLVAKYKISNILQYADAAATQVYMIDYINKNVTDGKDQAILRSIFANQGLHDTVYPMIRAKIEQQIQKAPGDLLITSGSFYDELNQYGSPDYNASYLAMAYQNSLDVAKSEAAKLALQEIQTSEGFLPVRNCTDIIVTQRQYDQDNVRLSAEARQAEDALLNLQRVKAESSFTKAYSVDKNEMDLAKAKLQEAQKNLQEFGKTKKAFTPPCGPIVNPGSAIAQSINSYLSSHLGSAANLKTENLPFFATFAESVASNFLTNIITSGLRPNNNLLTENGYQQSAISPTTVIDDKGESGYLKISDVVTERDTTIFSGEKTANTSLNQYTLRWNVEAIPNASYVIITGPNQISVRRNVLSGQVTANAPSGGPYVLTVYNAQNQSLDSTTFEIPPLLQSGQLDLSGVKDGVGDSNALIDSIIDDVDTGPPLEILEQQNPGLTTTTPGSPFTFRPAAKVGSVAGASVKRPSEPPRGHKVEKLR